ncbi:MAG TPA: glycoside hydrolase family 5 protein [Candidatus Omnitrophota bacterium]|nr:glycoside hydrolase family 5 protein [Candidatus Omnitrophota bacterium]HPD84339.1 glycoside hydrolase family 5 protein [Candidatus Omnitrophota bacterium]HRZ03197.1 glycoside hydrolase family 5 protein [Candidatus Omnitrophota bacterium]
MREFLRAQGTKIVISRNKPVILKGVNLGGWLMMEGYILHSPNIAAQVFKKNFAKRLGEKELRSFEKNFYDNFIREDDFKTIAAMNLNCVRLPFNCRLIEKSPYRYDSNGVSYLDRAIRWAEKHGIWIILDLHAAWGAQNGDWHSDSLGKADLWSRKDFRNRTLALWEFLADRYKEKQALAGYDLLNEAVTDDTKGLNAFYQSLVKRIRAVDKNHILFVEGNTWATDLDCLDEFSDDNLALSIHAYRPLDFTFNFVPHLSYPLKCQGSVWDKGGLRKYLSGYKKTSEKRNRPIFVGEFGVNNRDGLYNEERWVRDILACFKEFGFHWTYWTYKAVKNNIFPDGIFSYLDNPPWVNRQGPLTGWDTYAGCWCKEKKEMIKSWQTDSFHKNVPIVEVLRNAR